MRHCLNGGRCHCRDRSARHVSLLQTTGAGTDDRGVSDPVVRRWARYGHDRLYVTTPDGSNLGFYDLKTGASHLQDEQCRSAFEASVARYLTSGHPTTDMTRERAPEQIVDATPVAPTWIDFAERQPGHMARQQAREKRQEAPVKTFLARVLGVHTDERAWRIGADGEEAVAKRLEHLGEGWRVLHSVPIGDRGSDIDHVVIGPGGIYTINTKNHPDAMVWVRGDTFLVNGQRQPYIRNSRYEARRVSRLLSERVGSTVTVIGVIAVMGSRRGFTIKAQPEDGVVVVVPRRQVGDWIGQHPALLTSDAVDQLYAVARRSDTWC